MNILTQKIFSSSKFNQIKSPAEQKFFFTGINGSLQSFVTAYLFEKFCKKIIICSTDSSKLFKLKDDLNLILGNETASIYLGKYDEEYESEITPLSETLRKLTSDESYILLFEPSVFEKPIISEQSFKANIISLAKNSEYDFEELITKLREFNFVRKNIVEEENDFAVRGGIIDLYPENLSQPVRIEFFGNTIESIREFDIVTQRSISQLESVEILPSLEEIGIMQEASEKLIDYIKNDNLVLIDEPDLVKDEYSDIFTRLLEYKNSFFSLFPLAESGICK